MTTPDRRKAVALQYEAGQAAPKTIAKGNGAVAESIIRIARDNGVFVHQSPELVSLLMQLDLDQQIPESLYAVIAELLAWVYAIDAQQERQED
ncbi:EscU/YscU/HrcU family type III secretion system export apparatus switch protein [Bordetella sp. 02P26C-1]|uniref:EscU/YscU/HrcU family type III secretion system export apparatus switch protein n=1 Tax=Bordetella sp. 02P26C-1 TaxID=2683195 RepID=UPI001355ED41|nr:EscU/YscU/HrcU family type III secretion system export apparatus switch protein [Bordetella sp. 02P26C-1]MVW78165.1 flagellar biosynthesis protein [Bordetella sp. 02P26C-1]